MKTDPKKIRHYRGVTITLVILSFLLVNLTAYLGIYVFLVISSFILLGMGALLMATECSIKKHQRFMQECSRLSDDEFFLELSERDEGDRMSVLTFLTEDSLRRLYLAYLYPSRIHDQRSHQLFIEIQECV